MMSSTAQSTYPPPPLFYHLFDVDADNLQKPPEPPSCFFTKLGIPQSASLLEHGLGNEMEESEESKDVNPVDRMRTLNKSLLNHYIKILDTLITAGDTRAEVEAFSQTFLELTHLLTLNRPRQARQHLIALLRRQIADRRNQLSAMDACIDEARNLMANPAQAVRLSSDATTSSKNDNEMNADADKAMNLTELKNQLDAL